MEKVSNIVRQFVDDPAGNYKYLGELEAGKHFVEYVFTGDFVEDDTVLCVGTRRTLVIEANICRWADCDEEVLAMKYIAENMEDEI